MKRKLRFFRQHSLETCGISCILMILDYYHRVQYPTVKQERKLYGLYRSRAFCGVQAASAAECLFKNGLNVMMFHESPVFIENRGEYYDTTHEQDMERIKAIQECDCWTCVMVYDKPHAPKLTIRLKRWTNNPFFYGKTHNFEEFLKHNYKSA